MTIKVGDIVTWRSGKSKSDKTLPMGIAGCRVLGFGVAENGEQAAMLKLPIGLHDLPEEYNAYVADLEPQT
jgi:hypothetical protein